MGDFKPLMLLGGIPLIQRTVQSAFNGGAQDVVVITGRESARVQAALGNDADERITFVTNADFATTDMLQSIKFGLQALKEDVEKLGSNPPDAVFILPGDIPAVHPETFSALCETIQIKATPVICPSYRGAQGHPLLLTRECFGTILGFTGEGGLKAAIAPFAASSLEVDDKGVLLDADTPEAFKILSDHVQKNG
jgi:CTP:molybdopterin cytidylyltransferase MocA